MTRLMLYQKQEIRELLLDSIMASRKRTNLPRVCPAARFLSSSRLEYKVVLEARRFKMVDSPVSANTGLSLCKYKCMIQKWLSVIVIGVLRNCDRLIQTVWVLYCHSDLALATFHIAV